MPYTFAHEIKNEQNMNNKIGFSNFRKFAEFPEIDLGDITVLVGGNNSGKSTLVKAFLLCVDNLRMMRMSDRRRNERTSPLAFDKPLFRFDANEYNDVKIKTFSRAIHNNLVDDGGKACLPSTITFKFTIAPFSFVIVVSGNRDEELTYGDVLSISITDNARHYRYINNYEHKTMSFDIMKDPKEDSDEKGTFLFRFKKIDEQLMKALDLEEISNLTEEKDKIEAAYKKQFGEDITVMNSEDGPTACSTKYVDGAVAEHYDFPLGILFDEVHQPVMENVISNFINFATTSSSPNDSEEEVEGKKAMSLELDKMYKSSAELHALLCSLDVQYISAHAANQNTLYNTADRNDYLAQVVHDFYREKIVPGEKEYEFVTDWMQTFGIGKNFKIDAVVPGEAYCLTIMDADNTEQPLADKGMGSIQMMMLLLRLATIARKKKSAGGSTTVVIEEPEQNLHPKMQSLLADLFQSIATSNEYNINFIIETHSEYLIRKSQVLVANANYADGKDIEENCPFTVYYLPTDAGEPYRMHYKTTGGLVEKFGTGFFDAATESDMVIIRKEFEQKKKNRK